MRRVVLPRSLAFWVPVGIIAFCLIVLTLSTIVIYTGSRDVAQTSHQSHANYMLLTLKRHVEVNLSLNKPDEIRHDISVMGTVPEVLNIAVTDSTGRVIFSNHFSDIGKSLPEIASHSSAESLTRALAGNMPVITFSSEHSQLEALQSFALPSHLELRSSRRGLVFLRYNLAFSEQALWQQIRFDLLLLWSGCGLLVLLVMILLRRRVIAPLGELAMQATLLASGAEPLKPVRSGFKEIATLANTFSWVSHAISEHIAALAKNQQELESQVSLRTEELRSANLNYEQAQKMARLGRWELDDGLMHFSHEAYDIVGADPSQRVSLRALFGHSEDVAEPAMRAILDEQQTHHDFSYELHYKEGARRFVRLVAERCQDRNTGRSKVVGIVQDISEQMRKEHSLIENQAMTRAIIDTAADAIIVINTRGEVQEFSPAAVEMFGYEPAEVLGNNLKMLMPEPDRSQHDQYMQDYFATGVKKVIDNKREVTARNKNGACFPIDLAVAETQVGDITYFTAIIRDITERKEAEKKLLEAMQAAQSATRAKSEFLANMSHEIRTPMHAITGLTHLAMKIDAPPKMRNYLNKIQYAADSLLLILNDILDISKIEAGKLSLELVPFRLAKVVDHACELIATRVEQKQLTFEVHCAEDLPEVLMGDPLRLGQVLLNLLSNAVKFTPRYGKVSLELAIQARSERGVQLLFTVSDSGIGISQSQQQTLFSPFTQADTSTTRQFGGTGLGLAICKNLVRLMGGKIWCESEVGQGAQFMITAEFDIALEQDEPVPQSGRLDETQLVQALSGAVVLLVEDNDINREIAQEILQDAGMEVITAVHGKEAIERLCDSQVDLVLMDCQMPVMDGYTATREIRNMPDCGQVPIIALSANVMQHDLQQIKACGMDDHIAKPINVELAYQKIYQWLHRKPLRQSIAQDNTPLPSAPPPVLSAEPAAPPEPESCELLDFAQGLKHVNGNAAFYHKMSDKFIAAQREFCASLTQTLQAQDIEGAIRMAHTLKGQAGYLGLLRCAELAAQLERAIADQVPQLAQQIQALDDVLQRSCALLKAAFEE
ncbi:PAS domain-containing hybrid sensor histidine kinase/response regulator [Pseudoalteromonas rubra]|uniref:PAS domain-containing hybrid sensor histidine kinase/response regulator n=1 Tax=Pseudoalteromonas rubra TaxID=43658 RepID=UPI000F79FC45|nr:PAS domain S-box protein [Pseudoalteromonas rubra]